MRKLAVIGAFGDGQPTSSGQIIRTRITYDEFVGRFGNRRVLRVSTTGSENRKFRFALRLAYALLSCDYLFVIVSENGMHALYPIMRFAADHLRKTVLNSIVGGTVLPILQAYPECTEAMKAFRINWVQLPSMVTEMASAGITNTEVLPNSKPLRAVPIDDGEPVRREPFNFCTFSRVSEDKGIERAIEAVSAVNRKYGRTVATLDIFGQPDKDYQQRFAELQAQFPDFIRYRGIVPYDQTVDCLKNYYAVLFPTTFDGEGFPGTLVDAFFSGVPVIATDWRHNAEILEHGKTGLLYDYRDEHALCLSVEEAVQNPELFSQMRKNCIAESERYTIDSVMQIVFKYFQNHEHVG